MLQELIQDLIQNLTQCLTQLAQIDAQVFHWINSTWTHPFLDQFFPAITDFHKTLFFKVAFVPFIFLVLVWKKRVEGFWIFLGGLLTLGLADFIGGKLIKPFFARSRPPLVIEDLILRSPQFGGYSFTSNHASNIFCAAAFFSYFFPKLTPWLFLFAGLIAYSRVYCGVHFPLDVIVGAIWGGLLGYLGARALAYFYSRFPNQRIV